MPTAPLRDIVRLAESAIAAGRPDEALKRCDLLLAANPRWLDMLHVKAAALIALGQPERAIPLLDGILACHPEHAQAFLTRAQALQQQGDQLGSLACYRRACELAPEDGSLRYRHNQLAAQLGRAPYTPSQSGLARIYMRSELFAHALRAWDVALLANRARLDAQVGIAETLWRMGHQDRANAVCQHILHQMPNCLKAQLLLVYAALKAGNTEEARRLVLLAGEMDPEQVVAGELFADLVALGESDLAQVFRDATLSVTARISNAALGRTSPSTSLNDSAHSLFAAPMPRGQAATGPLFAPPPVADTLLPTNKLSIPTAAEVSDTQRLGSYFSRSRAGEATEEFQRIFRETEHMLWQKEQEEEFARQSLPGLPPASSPVDIANEPAPSEAELDFVRWLQDQGAQPLSETEPQAAIPPFAALTSDVPNGSIEIPPFLRAALQAESDHGLQGDFVSEPVARVAPPPQPMVAPDPDVQPPAPAWPEPGAMSMPSIPIAAAAPPVAPLPATPPSIAPLPVAPPSIAPLPAAPAEQSPNGAPPALTMEAIELGLSSVGFARHETGRLASVASQLGSAPVDESLRTLDVNAQLASARELRHAGRLGEALGEYRALVKADADHLPQILRSLLDAAIEDPNEPEIYRLLGDLYIRMGNYLESLEAYNKASALKQEEH